MSYENFPWFKDVPVGKILNVDEPTPGHYYWPELGVDLTEESNLASRTVSTESKVTHNNRLADTRGRCCPLTMCP